MDEKGKRNVDPDEDDRKRTECRAVCEAGWERPEEGMTKVNVDGSFIAQTGEAGIGVIARDHQEGLRLAGQWCQGTVILGTDCARVAEALRSPNYRSDLCFVTAEALALGSILTQWSAHQATENDQSAKKPQKVNSILCQDCEGNGAIVCTQCEGGGVNSVDHFNGRFKAGALCWLCRGKREILCGSCNGAGFLGGFMSTFDETAQ